MGAGGAGLDAQAAELANTRFKRWPGVRRHIAGALWAWRTSERCRLRRRPTVRHGTAACHPQRWPMDRGTARACVSRRKRRWTMAGSISRWFAKCRWGACLKRFPSFCARATSAGRRSSTSVAAVHIACKRSHAHSRRWRTDRLTARRVRNHAASRSSAGSRYLTAPDYVAAYYCGHWGALEFATVEWRVVRFAGGFGGLERPFVIYGENREVGGLSGGNLAVDAQNARGAGAEKLTRRVNDIFFVCTNSANARANAVSKPVMPNGARSNSTSLLAG